MASTPPASDDLPVAPGGLAADAAGPTDTTTPLTSPGKPSSGTDTATAGAPGPTDISPPAAGPGTPSPAGGVPAADAAEATTPPETAPRDIAEPPADRSLQLVRGTTPTLRKGIRQIFFDFNQAPRDIIRLMDEVKQREQSYRSQRSWRRVIAWLLFPAGLFFLILDVALGYNLCTFSIVAATLWAAGIVGLVWLGRQRAVQFDSRYDLTRDMFDVLKDDVADKRTLMGWLDLTGAEQESKVVRHGSSASGRPIVYYQDEWLRLKARLYDGNVLRTSLFDRVKVRKGYYKYGAISGKRKWRAGSSERMHRLRIAVTANPDAYGIQPVSHTGAIPNSRFVLESAEVVGGPRPGQGGQLRLTAAATSNFDAWDVLNAMRFAYDQLQSHQAE